TQRCQVSGDPHYRTFDSQSINYQGVCLYTLSETVGLEPGSDLVPFAVNSKPEHRYNNERVSWTQYIEIQIYGSTIRLDKGRKVYVDGIEVELSYQINPQWRVFMAGNKMTFEAENGLTVWFDGNHQAEIRAPTAYAGQVYGICGNMDKDRQNDLVTKTGEKVPSTSEGQNTIGDSYVVPGAIDSEG
ncbi:hypothetical protein CAPTEDRAFT_115658, partial [Capitella teleta]